MMPNDVVISREQYQVAESLATETFAIYKNSKGHYNNTANTHLRGKIGELAVSAWLDSNEIAHEAVFRDKNRMAEADILAGQAFLEVKTWDTAYWADLGRCIAVDQLAKLKNKASRVVWCVTPSNLKPGITVEIVGWSTIDDIEGAPSRHTSVNGGQSVHNYQVDIVSLRPPEDLMAELSP